MTTTPDEPIRVTVETVEQVYGYGEWRTVPVPSLYQQAFGKEEPMANRRGEPIETERVSVEEILRPLAEAVVECPGGGSTPSGAGTWHGIGLCPCNGGVVGQPHSIPDPRFEALRLPFAVVAQRPQGGPQEPWHVTWGGVDASLEAIVLAAAACEYSCWLLPEGADKWFAEVHHPASSAPGSRARGATPGEALARALVGAWNDEKRSSGKAQSGG